MTRSTTRRDTSEDFIIRGALSQGPLGGVGWARFDAPVLGPLFVVWVGEGLVMVRFGGEPAPRDELLRVLPELPSIGELPEAVLPAVVSETFSAYFDRAAIDPCALPVRLSGSPFHRRVWECLRAVPRGSVRTYAGLAMDVQSPRATRAVGTAMARNPLPIVVPCHRVVASGSSLGGFSAGLERKRALLALEGVKVEGERVHFGQLDLLSAR
jgi:O-6-methylguanine DNA methyltransferase